MLVNSANVVNGAVVETLAEAKMAFRQLHPRDGSAGPTGSQVMYMFSEKISISPNGTICYLSFWPLGTKTGQHRCRRNTPSTKRNVTAGRLIPRAAMSSRDSSKCIDTVTSFSTVRSDIAIHRPEHAGSRILWRVHWRGGQPMEHARRLHPTGADDGAVVRKRVELFHLPSADNQSKVRLRFAAG